MAYASRAGLRRSRSNVMKQLLQNAGSGAVVLADVPTPMRPPGSLLVANRFSLISSGTERAAISAANASLSDKVRQRPELVQKALASARQEGLMVAADRVRGRLTAPAALGYSCCGVALEVPANSPVAPGELVACAGAGYANHAEVVAVPRLLCARVPPSVPAQDAAYATVAAIGLHGVRLAGVGLGDVVAVIGLGLVGQLVLELVRAAGGVPVGVDLDPDRVDLAREAGFAAVTDAGELESEVRARTAGRGADAVLVTAASRSLDPLATAVGVARERAVVSIVGDVPVQVQRQALFAKELRLVVSRSYGPGRYDATYEEGGHDYPPGYVRWTEERNLQEVLRLMDVGALCPARLTSSIFEVQLGVEAYEKLEAGGSLGILIRYPELVRAGSQTVVMPAANPRRISQRRRRPGRLRVGVIGTGMFARTVLMPSVARIAEIRAVCSSTSNSAHSAAARYGADRASTDARAVIEADDVDAVMIATRHDTHADLAARALDAGKHVFVEKPLAIDDAGLKQIAQVAATAEGVLMVGFNRRFAPMAAELRAALADRGPIIVDYRVNAGTVDVSNWVQDPAVGGGRLVGEVCHFLDFASFMAGGAPTSATALAVGGGAPPRDDNVCISATFADGSLATITYSAMGDPRLGKERVEVFSTLGAGVLEDFRELTLYTGAQVRQRTQRQQKGHAQELSVFVEACRSGVQPWPVADMIGVTATTLRLRDMICGVGQS